ncbi:MAG: hypothetical protein ACYTGL_05185 [Planctomycetota bacterium]|jgi:hypothetical protein
MAWSKRQKEGFFGFCLWVFGISLTASLTFHTGGPVPIFAAVTIWAGTWLNTRANYMEALEKDRKPKNADE